MGRKALNPTSLTEDQHDELIEACFDLNPIFVTAQKFGFRNKSGFQTYLNNNPEFYAVVKQSRIDACVFIEDAVMQLTKSKDHHMAKVSLEIYSRSLAWRMPHKYSQRIDMNVNQNVSIMHNIESADQRLLGLLKDVTPALTAGSAG